jgi:hypothetical protein
VGVRHLLVGVRLLAQKHISFISFLFRFLSYFLSFNWTFNETYDEFRLSNSINPRVSYGNDVVDSRIKLSGLI